MMEAYIAVLTKGICQSDENGSFLIKDYDVRKAYLAGSVKGEFVRRENNVTAYTQCPAWSPVSSSHSIFLLLLLQSS